MNRYSITETAETGIYEAGDNYLCHITIRDILTTAKSSPSSVMIKISSPCEEELISATMTSTATGVYYYDYSILIDAVYGKYTVEISTTTYSMKKNFSFYVFPWNVIKEVRELSGIKENKSISDNSLAQLIWESYLEVKSQVFVYEYNEKPYCKSSYTFNGTNTIFWAPHKYLADFDDDGTVRGYGEKSCATDITMIWEDKDYGFHVGNVTVVDADDGKLTLTQLDGSAIPESYHWVYLNYYTQSDVYSRTGMHAAVEYLAAHKVVLRFGELERATAVDLASSQNVKYVNPNRFYIEYRRIINMIRKPVVGGVSLNDLF